jgi:hypothetical protein
LAASVIAICNRALDMLGQRPIISFGDNTATSEACERNYALSRDAVLRSYPWNSAVARAALPALDETPAWGFGYQYQLPIDCLRVLDSEGDLDGVKWRREGNRILCDEAAPLNIRYIRQITDPGLFDPMLSDAIAAHLARSIAYQVTGSNSAVEAAEAIYQRTVREARMMDAREMSQDETLAADTWFNARW